jgi:hypothetical protein
MALRIEIEVPSPVLPLLPRLALQLVFLAALAAAMVKR